jgi:predicted CopG family antitoxin
MEKRMSDYTISIPDSVYQKARQIAQQKSLSVDEVIRTRLEGAFDQLLFDLPDDEKEELKAMAYLSDDTLWTIAREQMQPALEKRISELLTKNQRDTISTAEYQELEELVERGDKLTLRKSQAMKYLTERGYSISLDDLKSADE